MPPNLLQNPSTAVSVILWTVERQRNTRNGLITCLVDTTKSLQILFAIAVSVSLKIHDGSQTGLTDEIMYLIFPRDRRLALETI